MAFICFSWSLLTFINSFATHVALLMVTRVLIGALQAFGLPVSYSISNDLFPQRLRVRVFFLLSIVASLDQALPYATTPLISAFGWRGTFRFIGIYGMVVGVLAYFFVVDPPRERRDNDESNKGHGKLKITPKQVLVDTLKNFWQILSQGSALVALLAVAAREWGTKLSIEYDQRFMSAHVQEYKLYNQMMTFSVVILIVVVNLASGAVVETFSAKHAMTIPLLCIGKALGEFVGMCFMFTTDSFWVSVGGKYIQLLFGKGWTAPALLVIKTILPEDLVCYSVSIYCIVADIMDSLAPSIFSAVKIHTVGS
jgi:MFS family permease